MRRPGRAGARRITGLATAFAIALSAGCADDTGPVPDGGGTGPAAIWADGPRPLDEAESQRLAVARYRNLDAGVRSIEVEVAGPPGEPATRLTGWIDFVAHRGYAAASSGDAPLGLLFWSPESLALRGWDQAVPPLPVPADGWTATSLDADATALTAVLALLLSLGGDRPENDLLLRQSDARWLRSETVDGIPVDVFVGPSATGPSADPGPGAASSARPSSAGPSSADPGGDRIRYWLDATGTMHLVEAPLPGSDEPARVRLGDAAGVRVADILAGTP